MLFANFGPTCVKKSIKRVSNFRSFCYVCVIIAMKRIGYVLCFSRFVKNIIYCAPGLFDILLVFMKKLFVVEFFLLYECSI